MMNSDGPITTTNIEQDLREAGDDHGSETVTRGDRSCEIDSTNQIEDAGNMRLVCNSPNVKHKHDQSQQQQLLLILDSHQGIKHDEAVSDSEMDQDTTNYNHQCYICDKIFSANSNLNRHLRKIHRENVQSPYNNVKCALCDSVYSSSAIYNQHLEKDHQVRIKIERKTFSTKGSFEEWKHSVETETTSQFIKSRGEKKTKSVNKTYYSCNRSGYYVSKARTRKALKKQGSRKINGRCPASMNVTINPDSTYDVKYVSTHVGHNFELKHLDLSDKDRELIVQKLVSGVTKKEIIKQLRSSTEQHTTTTSVSPASSVSLTGNTAMITNGNGHVIPTASEIVISSSNTSFHPVTSNVSTANIVPMTGSHSPSLSGNDSPYFLSNQSNQPTSRLHLATTKDIHNIINSKHLDSKRIRHNYDLNNVEAWISEMREFCEASSVLFYKSQSEIIDRFAQLREDDFMLIIMKDGQTECFQKHGHKCIIIDSTYHVHCEYLQLSAVSVIDDEGKALPVAFLFSTRTDCEVLEAFFTILKDKVGNVNTMMVIADELNDFYQAWTKVMSRPTHNFLTPWSVFESWTRKMETIVNREKLRRVKKALRTLLIESDSDKFAKHLTKLRDEFGQDEDCSEFMRYFQEKFLVNQDLWSSCSRKNCGATNLQLLRLHDKFKLVYKEGKNSKKLCRYVASLMTLFDTSQLELLSRMEDKNPAKQKALLDRHKKSTEVVSVVYEVAVEPVYWLCPSESSSEVYYEVRREGKRDQTCLCDLKCPTCASCRHDYKCTCLDYVVNLNMCKHIHRICTMCKQ